MLNKACAALEDGNLALDGVLAGIDYNDEQKLGDSKNRDNVLSRLVQHFSGCNLRNANLSEPDMLGRAYEGDQSARSWTCFVNNAGRYGRLHA